MTFVQAMDRFIKLQNQIQEAKKEFERLIESNVDIVKKRKEFHDLLDQYKKETKDYFGFSDGEQTNILQLADFVMKIAKKKK